MARRRTAGTALPPVERLQIDGPTGRVLERMYTLLTQLRALENLPEAADGTGTPGDVTQQGTRGRAAFAAGGSSVTVTNSSVTDTSIVNATLQTVDGTLTQVVAVVPTFGSFTVYGNAAATGDTNFCWQLTE